MITLKFKIGKAVIEVQGKNEKELIEDASLFYELPCECGLCKSTNVGFKHRRTKEFDFYEEVCLDCGATFAFGQKKEGGGLFPKGDDKGEWAPKYERQERHDDRGDSRNDRRRDDPPPRRDDRGGRQQEERRREPDNRRAPQQGRGAQQPDDQDDIPFNDRSSRTP